jgi:hypothetical protein
MPAQYWLDELDFFEALPPLLATWDSNSHCMRRGAGRETLAFWVYKTTGVLAPAWFWRQALMNAVWRGWAVKLQSECGYSCFLFGA